MASVSSHVFLPFFWPTFATARLFFYFLFFFYIYVFQWRPFAPIPTRRYASLPFESQRRLIPVPEEEGSADERLTSPEEIFAFPVYELDISGDDYGDMEYQQVTMEQGDVEATAVLVEDKT